MELGAILYSPVKVSLRKGKTIEVTTDEHPREDTTMESLGRLGAAFKEGAELGDFFPVRGRRRGHSHIGGAIDA